MKAATSQEMRAIDRAAIKELGIPAPVLMERAGLAAAAHLESAFPHRKVLVICGGGNNGGDGLVLARELHCRGYSAKAIITADKTRLSPSCARQLGIAQKTGVQVSFGTALPQKALHASVVVDALFGTGLNKEITGPLARLIRSINTSGRPVLALDIPSGVSADTGAMMGAAVRADMTVTFGLPKRGHFLHPGAELSGRLVVENIGFPPALFESVACDVTELQDAAALLPARPAASHKGDFGHVLLLAGSAGKCGAALMAARACLRAGAGLVTIAAPASLLPALQCRVTEEMLLPLPENSQGGIAPDALKTITSFLKSEAGVLAAGPGLGRGHAQSAIVQALVTTSPVPMLLDADALNALESNSRILKKAKAPVLITPHPGEFVRLSGMTKAELLADRIGAARGFAKANGVCVLLKGASSVIASHKENLSLNTTGTPGMAKAGTGDALTGIAAGLMAQGLGPFEAAVLGAYLHGLAGEIAAARLNSRSILSSDLIEAIPEAFGRMESAGEDA